MENNNKQQDLHWSHGWANINWELYVKVKLARAYPNPNPMGVRINEKHLAKYLENRHNLDTQGW